MAHVRSRALGPRAALALLFLPGCFYSTGDLFSDFAQVAAGREQTCGLKTGGTVSCWGGFHRDNTPPDGRWEGIDAYEDHVCVFSGSDVTCFGAPGYAPPPGLTEGPLPYRVKQIATGGDMDCVLGDDGRAYCFPYDPGFQVSGVPTSTAVSLTTIDVGDRHGCGLGEDGLVYCFGDDARGQHVVLDTPVCGTFPEDQYGEYLAVSAAANYSCVSYGGPGCSYGEDYFRCYGEIPGGSSGADDDPWSLIGAGANFYCFVESDGVVCEGSGERLIDAPYDDGFGGLSFDIADLSVGGTHACVVGSDTVVRCWGSNKEGESSPGS